MKIEDRINQVEQDIVFSVYRAEEEGFAKYYPYIKEYTDMLSKLRTAKKIRDRNKAKSDEDF